MEILVTLGIGAAGGIIALILEQIYLYLKEKRTYEQQRLITFPHNERIIDDSIFTHLRHGSSVEMMKSTLGMPNRIVKYDSPVFEISHWDLSEGAQPNESQDNTEEGLGVSTHSYLYQFKNADVKITSKDNETIDSLTVISKDQSIGFGSLLFPWSEDPNLKFGEVKVTKEMIGDCRPEHIQSRWDNAFVLSLYAGAPTYDLFHLFWIRPLRARTRAGQR